MIGTSKIPFAAACPGKHRGKVSDGQRYSPLAEAAFIAVGVSPTPFVEAVTVWLLTARFHW